MSIKNDGRIAIAVGESRRSARWQNREMQWSDLVERLNMPTRTQETQEEYVRAPKRKRDEIKDVGGFVGGPLRGGRRRADNLLPRNLITLDIDNVPKGEDPWQVVVNEMGCAALLYSTHSHTPEEQRVRIVIPLTRTVDADEYAALSRRVGGDIGIDMCDDTTFEPHRLMYWPSLPRDAEFRYEFQDGPWLDVDEQLKRYTDWTDPAEWPVSSRRDNILERFAKRQGEPEEKPGVIGAFNRTYSIEESIDLFLPDVYKEAGEGRYSFAGGSTTGGLVLYNNGTFAYSHHGTDPAGGLLCNAFDLVRIHLYGDLDEEAKQGTPVNRLPSYLQMSELAIEDKYIRKELAATRLREVSSAFDEGEDIDWLTLLSVNTKGDIEATIDNALIIMQNDPALTGRYFFDEFRNRPVVCDSLPWISFESRVSDSWVDSDDAGLRLHLEKQYGIDSAFKISDAVELAMLQASRHPVREYLNGLDWDGEKRAERLFIDYLGAPDDHYTREVTKKSLIGAVARIMEPGCKHDHMLVLVGPQGCRKSSTLAKLGGDWFSDSLYTMTGKEAFEQIQGSWIIELSEMAATRKAEIEQTKQFISKQTDSYRAAYARRSQDHPRQCAFFGTTNDSEFMSDPTGGRRFWPIVVTDIGKKKGGLIDQELVDQIWAESVTRYEAGEAWYLDAKTEKEARKRQKAHTEQHSLTGIIENFLEKKIPEDWDEYDLGERLMFFDGGFSSGESEKLVTRESVCALEIWQELLKGNALHFNQRQAREINHILRHLDGWESHSSYDCGPLYGRQRAFIRAPELPDLLQ